MIRRPKTPSRLRGFSMLETVLVLAVMAIVFTQGFKIVDQNLTKTKVKSVALKLDTMTRALDLYTADNFQGLVAAGPQELNIDVLEPYLGTPVGPDAFRNSYKITTRTYTITVPDPATGGTIDTDALQALIVGTMDDPATSQVKESPILRLDVANAASTSAGFVAKGPATCAQFPGGPDAPDGQVCGAYGAYSIDAANFPATDFTDATFVSLVTAGDSSLYGDQLYRYDYGDPELNTMHTALLMNGQDIVDPGEITSVDRITLDNPDGTSAQIHADGTDEDLEIIANRSIGLNALNGDITLEAASNTIILNNTGIGPASCSGVLGPCTGDFPSLRADNGKMRLDNTETVFGDRVVQIHGADLMRTASGNIWAGNANIETVRTGDLNSLFARHDDVLHLQRDRDFGEVVIGKRMRYIPSSTSGITGGIYEISDGDLTAQHVQVQDITCADCGGSLSEILPKWRHMGTYFIPDGTSRSVPKPNCKSNRTRLKNRGAIGDEAGYFEGVDDNRYEAKIIVVPKQIATRDNKGGAGIIDFRFEATDAGNSWVTNATSQNGMASALAQTYCVFIGGDPDPTAPKKTLPQGGTADPLPTNMARIE